jgi:triacylglycerol lipase
MLPLKEPPVPSLTLVGRPEQDRSYVHFEHADEVPFDARAIDFSLRNAWWLSEAALLTYWSADEASTILRDAAQLESEFIDVDGTEAYVAWNDAAAIVAFRGTQPNQPIDVWTDVDVAQSAWTRPGERVHQGFEQALNDRVWRRINARLQALAGRSVWVTGHSLGAALATLAGDRLDQVAGIYTFGAPRVGDPAFARGFNQRHAGRSFRFVNNADVVTTVPAARLLDLQFAHVDREIHIDEHGHVGDAPLAGPPAAGARSEAVSPTLAVIGPVIDHTPRRYAVFVWNALAGAMAPAGPAPV